MQKDESKTKVSKKSGTVEKIDIDKSSNALKAIQKNAPNSNVPKTHAIDKSDKKKIEPTQPKTKISNSEESEEKTKVSKISETTEKIGKISKIEVAVIFL